LCAGLIPSGRILEGRAPKEKEPTMNRLTPPLTVTVLALVATLMAAPVMAQTITAPGLKGPAACVGPGETNDPLNGQMKSVAINGATIEIIAFTNLYSSLRGKAGDGAPSQFPIHYRARDARTNSVVFTSQRLVRITSTTQKLGRYNDKPISGLTARTPYVFEVYTTAGGLTDSPLLRRCFMTGGTYTPSNESGQPGYVPNTTSGCFSISPRTPQDTRNCLCGRSRIWNDDTQNTAARTTLGCAN